MVELVSHMSLEVGFRGKWMGANVWVVDATVDGMLEKREKKHLVKLFPLLSECVAVAQPDQELLRLLSRGLAELGGAVGWR